MILHLESWIVFCLLNVFAEWAEVGIWDSWLNQVEGKRHRKRFCMWSPCWSDSSEHSGKSSSLFCSATLCCSVLCSSPDGPHTSWLESKSWVEKWDSKLSIIKTVITGFLVFCRLCCWADSSSALFLIVQLYIKTFSHFAFDVFECASRNKVQYKTELNEVTRITCLHCCAALCIIDRLNDECI